jgi:hypothetical protein
MVRGHASYRCYRRNDYALPISDHPPSLAVREDRLCSQVDACPAKMFAADQIGETALLVVEADAQNSREDPPSAAPRATLAECERKISKYLDGLEAGIPAYVIAPRIASTQREKTAAEAVLARLLRHRNLLLSTR